MGALWGQAAWAMYTGVTTWPAVQRWRSSWGEISWRQREATVSKVGMVKDLVQAVLHLLTQL